MGEESDIVLVDALVSSLHSITPRLVLLGGKARLLDVAAFPGCKEFLFKTTTLASQTSLL